MSEPLLEQVAPFVSYGNAVVNGLPEFLDTIGLDEYLVRGDEHLLIYLREALSGQSHGEAADKYQVPNEGFASKIDWMIASGIWTPSGNISYPSPDEVDPDKPIGLSIPDLDKEVVSFAPGEKQADTSAGVGALFDGNVRRIQTTKKLSELGSETKEIVYLTGPRVTDGSREGLSGRYKEVDPTGSERPIEELYPTEYAQSKAIFEHEFPGIEKREVIRDESESGDLRGGEICTIYDLPMGQYGQAERVVVMNGLPILLPEAVNRPANIANPRAPDTFEEYLRLFGVEEASISYVSSFPHRNRIAIEGLMRVIDMGRGDRIRIFPQGQMSWPDKVTAGLHAGEVEPMMRLTRALIQKAGMPETLIPRTSRVLQSYLQTHSRSL